MYIRNSSKYGKQIHIIHPGEYHVTSEDIMIGTILGSCIAVCLYDLEAGVGGMNHFMLPGRISQQDIFSDKTARYGITAMNTLIQEVERQGGRHGHMEAKVFGGGHVLNTNQVNAIPDDNIRLARVMLELEDIPIIKSDVGEHYTRKIMLDVKTGKVFLKKTTREDVIDQINARDINYVRSELNE